MRRIELALRINFRNHPDGPKGQSLGTQLHTEESEDSRFALRASQNDELSAPPVAGVLHHIAVVALLADVLLFVVAMALGGVDGRAGRAAGAFVALVLLGDRLDGFCHGFCHCSSPLDARRKR